MQASAKEAPAWRKNMKKVMLPKNVKYIIDKLVTHGFEAYAVGGCIRDSILERVPEDWDITTSAKPEEMKALFKRTIDTGLQHGTVTILQGGGSYEVTTYRIDGEYEDHRHPSEVTYTLSLIEDLKRRDFTINAMAYNETIGIVDYFGGMEDIQKGVIRCVGEARQRFSEDALRILRAVRFSAQLGFEIEEQTWQAIEEVAGNLKDISAERIQVELVKLLLSNNPDYLRTAWEAGITKVVLPEFDKIMETEQNNPHHCYNVGEHTLEALKVTENNKVIRLAVLFHDIGKPETKSTDIDDKTHFYQHAEVGQKLTNKIMRRLKFDNDTRTKVVQLVKYHDRHPNVTAKGVRRLINHIGVDSYPLLLQVQRADIMAQSNYKRAEKLQTLMQISNIYEQILADKNCLMLKDLAITGKDLLAEGVHQGKEVGQILHQLLQAVLDDPSHNNKEYLIEYARELLYNNSQEGERRNQDEI